MKHRLSPFLTLKSMAACVRWLGVSAVFSVLAACATGPHASPKDPLEPFNRGVSRFNDTVDENVLVPVARTYVRVLPSMVRTGIANFFNNVGDVWNLANNVAQGKVENSAQTFMRLNVNTIFGLGGLLDIATEAGIDRHEEDFGQTLGYWGVGAGPYLVLPLFGPSSVRDAAALPVDRFGDPLSHMHDVAWRNSLAVQNLVQVRARFLRAGDLLNDVALDKYTFTRDAYLQHRRSDVYDGNPPDDQEDNNSGHDGKDGK